MDQRDPFARSYRRWMEAYAIDPRCAQEIWQRITRAMGLPLSAEPCRHRQDSGANTREGGTST